MTQAQPGGDSWRALVTWLQRPFAAALVAHVVLAVAFWPDAVTNTDESDYVRQANAFAHGVTHWQALGTVDGAQRLYNSTYPALSSLLMAPFAWAFGWRGAYLVPALSAVAAMAACVRLLDLNGLSRWWACLLLFYAPFLVLARVAGSDVLCTALVAWALTLCWEAIELPATPRRARLLAAAGALAGATAAVREVPTLASVPLFAYAVWRLRWGAWPLVAAGLAGVSIRLGTAAWLFGSPWYTRYANGTFGPQWWSQNLFAYLFQLLVMVPGGLVALLRYRGRHAVVIGVTIAYMVLVHMSYEQGMSEAFGAHLLILGTRFLMPVVPLVAVAIGWWWQRAPSPWMVRATPPLTRVATFALPVVTGATALVHPAMFQWSRPHAREAEVLCTQVPADAIVYLRASLSAKYLDGWRSCDRSALDFRWLTPQRVARDLQMGRPVYLFVASRDDSPRWVAVGSATGALAGTLSEHFTLRKVYESPPGHQALVVWQVLGR